MTADHLQSRLRLVSEPASCLADYERVPIAFKVEDCLAVMPIKGGLGGLRLRPERVARPYVKDYDRLPGQRPTDWAGRWDLGRWWFAAGFLGERRVGGVAVVMDAGEVCGADRPDVAVLWDIRVLPAGRRHGVGRRLIAFAEDEARKRGRRWMEVETQNVNVPACWFYAGAGYMVAAIDQHAYPDQPDEARLVWRKELG